MDTQEIMTEIRALRADMAALREDFNHYRGFAGGVLWCFSAVAGFVGFVWGVVTCL